MKSIMTSLLLCFAISAQAFAGSVTNLKEVFDDFNYAVTVEWDQSDSAFYENQMKQLELSIVKLQEEGLTNQELIDFGIAQIKNSHLKTEAMKILSLIDSEKLTETEALAMLQSVQEASCTNGASWTGRASVITATSIVVVIGVVIVAHQINKSKSNVKNNRTE